MENRELDSVEVLKRARELVANGWTRKTIARDANGRFVTVLSREATSFCVVGGLMRAQSEMGGFITRNLRRVLEIAADIEYRDIADWNDEPGRTKEEVLAVYDKAIESLSPQLIDVMAEAEAIVAQHEPVKEEVLV